MDLTAALFRGGLFFIERNDFMKKEYFYPADILLPKENFEKWAVIACDQYTSEPEYWESVGEYVGDSPSALNIILPEVYLSCDNGEAVARINANMRKYLNGGVFNTYEKTFVYTERTLSDGRIRKGAVGLIDLEDYSFKKGDRALIRATEETVAERIPPRVEIRKDAPLEIPHVMLLIDDPSGAVIEPLASKTGGFSLLYDFDLMKNGGHIRGFALDSGSAAALQSGLSALAGEGEDRLLFAVGDGNHSLASAKECYRLNKTERSRYALVEIVNIHDASLEFEPIYRLLSGVDPQSVINGFIAFSGGEYGGTDAQSFTCVYGGGSRRVSVRPSAKLAVGTLQNFLDKYIKENPGAETDYIHGEQSLRSLAAREKTVGFIFEGMKKSELFDAVKQDGALPRKTFSMGGADDKRFYLECRKL